MRDQRSLGQETCICCTRDAALEHTHEADRRAQKFLVSAAEGTSGLDLERLRDARDRAWR
jgi:hypothetical protein